MGGRNGKSIQLHLAEGNPNRLTKKEIARREKAEVKLGGDKLTCPMYVVTDPVAYKKWRDLIYDFNKAKANGIEIVKSSDAGILARYCKTYSEYLRLCENRDRIASIEPNWDRYKDVLPEELQDAVNYLLRVSVDLQMETAINKKQDMLIKMEDRLFLHPLAKVKNIPKKEPKKADPLADKGFGNV